MVIINDGCWLLPLVVIVNDGHWLLPLVEVGSDGRQWWLSMMVMVVNSVVAAGSSCQCWSLDS